MLALRSLVFALLCGTAFAACMKAPTVAFENATASPLTLRASVDSWFSISECNSGNVKGAMNLQGTYEIQSGQRLCMQAKGRKDSVPAAELISRMVVLRDAQRCLTLSRDEILNHIERSGGFNAYKITEERCPAVAAAPSRPAPAPAANPAANDDGE